jgi:cytochrome c
MSIRSRIGATAGIVLVVATAGAGEARADAARGRVLAEQWCSQCHGVRPNEASLTTAIPGFSAIAAESSVTEPSLRVFLRTSHPTMPNIILNQDDTDDLVSYILSLKPER